MRVFSQFQALFPIRSDQYAIELVGAPDEEAPADLRATVQTIVWEGEGAARTIRDIRQQPFHAFLPVLMTLTPRNRAGGLPWLTAFTCPGCPFPSKKLPPSW